MGKCSFYPNPSYAPAWSEEGHRRFIQWAFQYYCSKAGNPRPLCSRDWRDLGRDLTPPRINRCVVDYLYRLGKDLQVLRGSYGELVGELSNHPPFFRRFPIRSSYRQKQKYRRKPHHQKKSASQAEEDWRRLKGFARDYRKSKWRRSAPRWAHQISARARRRWERDQIQHENWDDIASGDYLQFIDPWLWD